MKAYGRILSLLIVSHLTYANQELPETRTRSRLGFNYPNKPNGGCGRNKIKDAYASPFLTASNSEFGPNIEGLSVTPAGRTYAVNFGNATTIFQLGQVFPVQKLIYKDPVPTAKFNGMQFQTEITAFAVDQNNARL